MKRRRPPKQRDPYWRERRALGQKVVRNRKKYRRKQKHRGKED